MAGLATEMYTEMPAGFWELDLARMRIVFNAALEDALNFPHDPGGHSLDQFRSLLGQASLQLATENFFHYTGAKTDAAFVQELMLSRRDGSALSLLCMGKVTAWTKKGKAIKMEGTYLDISRQKAASAAFRVRENQPDFPAWPQQQAAFVTAPSLKEQHLAAFISQCPAIMAMVDSSGSYVAASGSWRQQFKLETIEIEGKSHYDLFPDTPAIWKRYRRRAMAGEHLKMQEDSFTGTDGQTEWMQWEIVPWHQKSGEVGGIIIYIIMISDKHASNQNLTKAKEQAEQAAVIKSRFLSVMSHEMRTPLNGVIGFINLLLLDPRPDQLENMSVLKFSAENLLVLINNVLDFGKMDENKVELEETCFNLVNLLENITATQRLEAGAKGIQLQLAADSLIPGLLTGDPGRLGQVIINLVSNAIKFTHTGHVYLAATVTAQSQQATTITFEIEDTGIGIAQDQQQHIFEMFTQADSQTTRKYGGTGLGLTISKMLLELMGSRVRLSSQPGQGSTFSFVVSFANAAATGLQTAPAAHTDEQVLRGARILVAEDYPVNAIVVKRFLEKWQCVPSIAENGSIALEMARNNDYDLILMDLQMPVMDGYEAARQIRDLPGGRYRLLPIIALTASSISNRKEKIIGSGMDDLISKPFVPQQLFDLIIRYLKRES